MQDAKQYQSKIAIAESKISNLDKSLIKTLQLLSLFGQLDSDIEQMRIDLSDNSHFYPEAMFSYLKQYNRDQTVKTQDFFDFSENIQVKNNSKVIKYEKIILFLEDQLKYKCSEETLRYIRNLYLVENPTIIAQAQYPLPSDVQVVQTPQPIQQVQQEEGFNYETFLKMFLSQSIPSAKLRTNKRKLLYDNYKVEDQIKILVAELIRYEAEIYVKSEPLRSIIARDINQVTAFEIFNQGSSEIQYNSIELFMKQAQIPFKPANFQAIVRRAHLLNKSTSSKDVLTFEDFRVLISVHNPYFKHPLKQQQQNLEYSSLLSLGGNNSLSISKIPEKLQGSAGIIKQNHITPYKSTNLAVNEMIQQRSKISQNVQPQQTENDFIVYGTKKEWDEIQHSLSGGAIASQSLKSQIMKIQQSQIINPQQDSSRSKRFGSAKTEKHLALEPQYTSTFGGLDERSKQYSTPQQQQSGIFHSKNVNTKQYISAQPQTYANLYNNQNQQQTPNNQQSNQNLQQTLNYNNYSSPAPWNQTDAQTLQKISNIKSQQQDLIAVSGITRQGFKNSDEIQTIPQTSQGLPPKPPSIFNSQQRSQQVNERSNIMMNYRYDLNK
ncbi:hypothetical protein pb186bvf_002595 [Paramecium bursaria]